MTKRILQWLLLLLLFVKSLALPLENQHAEEYRVTSLPGMPDSMASSLKQYAGQINLDSSRRMFFWFMESKIVNSDYLVIWLNGGPGCSSMDGVFFEIGPFRFTGGGDSFHYNPDTWQRYAHILFVDQPVGVGFSQVTSPDALVKSMSDLTNNFALFLERFYERFPSMRSKKLILSGESFAGAYVPYIAAKLIDDAKSARIPHNIKSVVLGNPWMDSQAQYRSYVDYSQKMRLVDEATQLRMEQQYWKCAEVLQKINTNPFVVTECDIILDIVEKYSREYTHPTSCINVYKVTESDKLCGLEYPFPDVNHMVEYLRRADVQRALHIQDPVVYTECSEVSVSKWPRTERSSISLLPDILDQNIQVFLYFGTLDLVCNHLGGEAMLARLTWQNMTGFAGQPQRIWCAERKILGYIQEGRGLHYYALYGTGHMAPYDASGATLEILRHAISQKGETYVQDDMYAPCNYLTLISWYAAMAIFINLLCCVAGFAICEAFKLHYKKKLASQLESNRPSLLLGQPMVSALPLRMPGHRAGYTAVSVVGDPVPVAESPVSTKVVDITPVDHVESV